MSHKGLREPHLLLASSNPFRLMRNLSGLLSKVQIRKIDGALKVEAKLLFDLGIHHFEFAQRTDDMNWRQKVSRLYYAAYNCKRSMSLIHDGSFSTESKDHEKISDLPCIPNQAMYKTKLTNLREDRNLADYSHLAQQADLVLPVSEAEVLVNDFITDCRSFLRSKGIAV